MEIAYTYPTGSPRLDQRSGAATDDAADAFALFGDDGLGFKDLLDSINPLQQLPVVGTLYRSLSGDTISTASRLAGGALMGGPVGFLAAVVNSGIEAISGSDIGDHLLAMITGDGESQYAASAYAKAQALEG